MVAPSCIGFLSKTTSVIIWSSIEKGPILHTNEVQRAMDTAARWHLTCSCRRTKHSPPSWLCTNSEFLSKLVVSFQNQPYTSLGTNTSQNGYSIFDTWNVCDVCRMGLNLHGMCTRRYLDCVWSVQLGLLTLPLFIIPSSLNNTSCNFAQILTLNPFRNVICLRWA